MDFAPQHLRRRPRENIVPMINVVFLLLIFFLMSAQIAPQPPVAIDPPQSGSEASVPREPELFVTVDGTIFFEGKSGKDAELALRERAPETAVLHADATMPASELAGVLRKLASFGISTAQLVTGARE